MKNRGPKGKHGRARVRAVGWLFHRAAILSPIIMQPSPAHLSYFTILFPRPSNDVSTILFMNT
jgi:hypothetical protein